MEDSLTTMTAAVAACEWPASELEQFIVRRSHCWGAMLLGYHTIQESLTTVTFQVIRASSSVRLLMSLARSQLVRCWWVSSAGMPDVLLGCVNDMLLLEKSTPHPSQRSGTLANDNQQNAFST